MALLYTVDRIGTLKKNLIIDLFKHNGIKPSELQIHIDYLFPDGITNHGNYYMLEEQTQLRA
jgi:hypothetical protein